MLFSTTFNVVIMLQFATYCLGLILILCFSNILMFSVNLLNLQATRLWTDPPCKLTQAHKICYYSRIFQASGKFIQLSMIFCSKQLNNLDSFYLPFSTIALSIVNSNFLYSLLIHMLHNFFSFSCDIQKHPLTHAKAGLNRMVHNISHISDVRYVSYCQARQFPAELQVSISMVNLKQKSSDIFRLLQARFQYF